MEVDYKIVLKIVDSDIDLEPIHEVDKYAPGIDLMFSTIFKGDPGQPILTRELVTEVPIGCVANGRVFHIGTPLEDILRDMFIMGQAIVGRSMVGRSRIS